MIACFRGYDDCIYMTWVGQMTYLGSRSVRQRFWVLTWSPRHAGQCDYCAVETSMLSSTIAVQFGYANAFWGILLAAVVIFVAVIQIAYDWAKYNLGVDLLTRGTGFGCLGSTIRSVVYASFTLIFFCSYSVLLRDHRSGNVVGAKFTRGSPKQPQRFNQAHAEFRGGMIFRQTTCSISSQPWAPLSAMTIAIPDRQLRG